MAPQRGKLILTLAGVAALILVMLYQGGFFATGVIAPGKVAAPPPGAPEKGHPAQAQARMIPDLYEAVGTVRPRMETRVEAQVSGRVMEVAVKAGDVVKEGQLLARLEDKEHRSRLEQARQGLGAAQAVLELAQKDHGRLSRLLKSGAAPRRDLDQAREALDRARANVNRAQEQVEEARIAVSYTRIRAPETGQVVRRLIEPGDMSLPGRPIVILQTGGALRLEAKVREGLIHKVKTGQELAALIPALGDRVTVKVDEIVPTADPLTRTFVVKAVLPPIEGIYTGMFGRLLIPVGQRRVVLVPAAALIRVGQLEMVLVKEDKGWRRVLVTSGRRLGDQVEILSGLDGQETVLVKDGSHA